MKSTLAAMHRTWRGLSMNKQMCIAFPPTVRNVVEGKRTSGTSCILDRRGVLDQMGELTKWIPVAGQSEMTRPG
jgi:hypothetical protein